MTFVWMWCDDLCDSHPHIFDKPSLYGWRDDAERWANDSDPEFDELLAKLRNPNWDEILA